MKVLVTGGAGFIGSHVVDQLPRAGHEPRDLRPRRRRRTTDGEVETVLGDLARSRAPSRAALDGCDAVVHLAAVADVNEVVDGSRPRRPRERARHADAARGGARRADRPLRLRQHDLGVRQRRRDRSRSTRTRRSACRRTSTRRRSSPARCTAARTASSTALEHTILRFGIPYGPRARPTAVVAAFVAKALRGQAADDRRRRHAVAPVRLRRGSRRRRRRGARARRRRTASTTSSATRTRACAQIADTVRELVGDVPIVHVEGRAGDLHGGNISGARAASRARLGAADDVRRRRPPLRRLGDATSGLAERRRPPRAPTAAPPPSSARSPPSCSGRRRAAARRRRAAGPRVARRAIDCRRRARAPSRGPSATRGAAASRARARARARRS